MTVVLYIQVQTSPWTSPALRMSAGDVSGSLSQFLIMLSMISMISRRFGEPDLFVGHWTVGGVPVGCTVT